MKLPAQLSSMETSYFTQNLTQKVDAKGEDEYIENYKINSGEDFPTFESGNNSNEDLNLTLNAKNFNLLKEYFIREKFPLFDSHCHPHETLDSFSHINQLQMEGAAIMTSQEIEWTSAEQVK